MGYLLLAEGLQLFQCPGYWGGEYGGGAENTTITQFSEKAFCFCLLLYTNVVFLLPLHTLKKNFNIHGIFPLHKRSIKVQIFLFLLKCSVNLVILKNISLKGFLENQKCFFFFLEPLFLKLAWNGRWFFFRNRIRNWMNHFGSLFCPTLIPVNTSSEKRRSCKVQKLF